ncbi:ankyrin repeat domain-containing protein [Demequina maris]|uniref:ankyrin repeat domain-containing protein n=1 Tax=Demequina maris TaxID=1638982 RepID=UPI00155A9B8A|nr:ankyrin repeat domain-containing protein [Demequina maris]
MAAIVGTVALAVAGCTGGGEELAPDLALKAAVVRGDVDGVRTALADGADVDAAPAGVTALHAAARRDDAEMVRLLLDAGADPDVRADVGDTAAHFAMYDVGTDALAALIEGGADVGMLGGLAYESAPAHYAAVRGNVAALDLLEAAGADLDVTNADGWRPIDQAVCAGQFDSVDWFLARGEYELSRGRACAADLGRDAMVAYIDGLG